MSRVETTFSKEQLEYIKSKYSVIINTIITPDIPYNTILYNAGVLAVIQTVADRTEGVLPTRPARS